MDQHKNRSIEETGQTSGRQALWLVALAPALALILALAVLSAYASTPLSIAGYADFSYGDVIAAEPSANTAQSKVWWNDGYWWGILYNTGEAEFSIYRLDADQQEWVDTGTAVDSRPNSRADALWDDEEQKLYVASHVKLENPSPPNNNPDNWARLFRYSYESGNNTYSLDTNFPAADVNQYISEALVLDKDSTGRLWTTWAGRTVTGTYHIYVSYTETAGNDLVWSEALTLPFQAEGTVSIDDISALVAFEDGEGPKIGVVWSNQLDDNFYFATHKDGDPPESWTLDGNFSAAMAGVPADDHMDFAKTADGRLFIVIKTGIDPISEPNEPLIGVVARESNGTTSFIEVGPGDSRDTRPIAVVNEDTPELYVFASSKSGGEAICQFTAAITSPLSNMIFDAENCSPPDGEPTDSPAALANLVNAPIFIGDVTTYHVINNASSTKQQVTGASGVLVLASDEGEKYYVHNLEGGTIPDPQETATPTPTATVTGTATATATPMGTPPVTGTPPPTATSGPPPEGDYFLYLPFWAK